MRRQDDDTVERLRGQAIALRKLVKERVRPWEVDLATELLAIASELDLQADQVERSATAL